MLSRQKALAKTNIKFEMDILEISLRTRGINLNIVQNVWLSFFTLTTRKKIESELNTSSNPM